MAPSKGRREERSARRTVSYSVHASAAASKMISCVFSCCAIAKGERKTDREQTKKDYSHLWYHHNENDVLQSPLTESHRSVTALISLHNTPLSATLMLTTAAHSFSSLSLSAVSLKWSSIQTRGIWIIQSVCIQQSLFVISRSIHDSCCCIPSMHLSTVWGQERTG